MPRTFIARLADRGAVAVTGPDAEKLLQGLVTNDMGLLASRPALHAGLLSPQGKILFDFIVVKTADGLMLDVRRDKAGELAQRLGLYKLRAAVDIRDVSDTNTVLAAWGEHPAFAADAGAFADPRLAALGLRAIVPRETASRDIAASSGAEIDAAAYHAHRIGLGVPEGGRDYAFGDAFPHEALFDQLGGVSFTKGCYVGQEIVSRMEHRGTARKRIVPVSAEGRLPATGTEVTAGGVVIGSLGSTAGGRGLALLRLDRLAEFRAKGETPVAGGVALTVERPHWATFTLEAASGA